MTTIKKITSKNADRIRPFINFKQISTGTLRFINPENKAPVVIDKHFNDLGIVAVAGIVADAVGASKLGVTEIITKLQNTVYTDSWTERFVYDNGEWRYKAETEGMAKYELMTIKREIFYKK